MTTPGATEPPTPEEIAYALYDAVRHMRPAEARAEIAKQLREAEVNALRRAAEAIELVVEMCCLDPEEEIICARGELEIHGFADIAALLPKEEGK